LQVLGEEPKPSAPVEDTGERETVGNLMLFRGRVGSIEVGARFAELDLSLLVDLDCTYAVRDTDKSSETIDHEGLLDRVVGISEGGDLGSVEAGSRSRAWPPWSTSPRSERSRCYQGARVEGRANLALTVTRTFRR
jgi:hypothetical protein